MTGKAKSLGEGKILTGKGEEFEMKEALENYRLLRQAITSWQKERGEQWTKRLVPNDSPPFYPPEKIPQAPILELTARLLRVKGRSLPADQLAASWQSCLSGHLEDEELAGLLLLALGGVLAVARQALPPDFHEAAAEQEGHCCPVCGQEATLTVLTSPVGKRYCYCLQCGQQWKTKRLGCSNCGCEDPALLTYLQSEEFPGVEIVACRSCCQGIKEVDLRKRAVEDLFWEQIRTLPLNYAAEKWLIEHALPNQCLNPLH